MVCEVMPMPVLEVSIVPVGTDDTSFSSFVSRTQDAVRRHGIKHQVTPMSTILEGSLEECLACARDMHQAALQAGAQRVVTNIVIDHRTDKRDSMEERVEAVTQARRP
jgi:uncharacterized protein (TIGR00106 family)